MIIYGWNEDIYIKENEIYSKDNVLIAKVNEEGQIIFEEGYLEELKELIKEEFKGIKDFDELGLQDEERKIYLEELLKENNKPIIELDEEAFEKLLEGNKEEIKKENLDDSKITAENLIKTGNGWEKYSSNDLIIVKETDKIYKDLPDLEKPLIFGYNESGEFAAYTIGENGEPLESKVINSARSVQNEVTHIGDKGEVKRIVPSAVMDTREDNLKISIKIGQYGYPEAQKIQITHDNKWIATDIDRQGDYYDKTYDTKYATDLNRHGQCGNEELIENYEEQEEVGDTDINLNEITHDSEQNIETIKRQVIDTALENYDELTREELNALIKSELISRLENDKLDLDKVIEDINEVVQDEARFPDRGERR